MSACLFDLDGTLLDSLADLAAAGNAALVHAGYTPYAAECYRHFLGSGLETLLRRALPEGEAEKIGDAGVTELVAFAREVYGRTWHVYSRPYPGVREVLMSLAERGQVLAVLSNKAHAWTVPIVEHFFPGVPFAMVRGAVPEMPLKPDPTSVLDMVQSLGFGPAECAYVGDSDVDMLTALRSGLLPVGVAWGFRGEEEVRAAGAQRVALKAGDFLHLL